ncbi:Cof-type HAD-IIB family hydrolase [Sporolactobacillus sp. THM7-7]|nr:Cof-type HAD-IIB family hydrolase [Sporolactobacillus sp. THM7-7]
MQPKIVFFDIDSTLYDFNKSVPDSTAEAIAILQEKGIVTVIATGRAPFMFSDLREKLNIHSFVSFNGSYVVYQHAPIYKSPLSRHALRELEKQSAERDYPLVFLNEKTMKADRGIGEKVKEGISSLKLKVPMPEKDPHFYLENDIYQALLFYSEKDDSAYLEKSPLDTFNYVRWHPYSVDVIPRHGSKAAGIRKVLEITGFSLEEACAFGDGNNDVEMLSYVGTGVAMGNAVRAAKAAADFVTRPVNQDGVYYGLRKIGLI